MKRRRGVTLIELLIAVSLLATLSVAMLLALRVGLGAMDRANARLIANRRAASVQRILASQISDMIPAFVRCGGPEEAAGASRLPFFDGRPTAMRFVTSYSLEEAARGYPRVVEFVVAPGERGEGVRLLVNEFYYAGLDGLRGLCTGLEADPLTGRRFPLFRPVAIGPRSFVLADRLAFCRFQYRELRPEPERARWVEQWTETQWPTAVHVEMAPLQADPGRVPLVSATVAIHVSRQPNERYTDQ